LQKLYQLYSRVQLIEYLQNYFSEIPEPIREAIVIAATSAARQAALFHSVVEKTAASRDSRKRKFAAEAASALPFWALGLRAAHRSAGGFVVTSSVKGTPDATAVETESKEQVQIDMMSLPVPLIDGDQEFQQLVQDCEPESRSMVLSPISSAAGCLGNEDLDLVSQSHAVMPSKSGWLLVLKICRLYPLLQLLWLLLLWLVQLHLFRWSLQHRRVEPVSRKFQPVTRAMSHHWLYTRRVIQHWSL